MRRKLTQKMPTEKQIETEILTWLNAQPGIFAFKVNTVGIFDPVRKKFRKIQNRFIVKGTADIIGLVSCGRLNGKFFAIEVKRPGKKPTKEQDVFLTTVSRHRGIGICATSTNGVIHYFKTILQPAPAGECGQPPPFLVRADKGDT